MIIMFFFVQFLNPMIECLDATLLLSLIVKFSKKSVQGIL